MQISKDGVTKSMLMQYANIDHEDTKTFLDTELDATTHPLSQDDTAAMIPSTSLGTQRRRMKANNTVVPSRYGALATGPRYNGRNAKTSGTNRNCSIQRSRIHLPQPEEPLVPTEAQVPVGGIKNSQVQNVRRQQCSTHVSQCTSHVPQNQAHKCQIPLLLMPCLLPIESVRTD
jgi:hypothetical protein